MALLDHFTADLAGDTVDRLPVHQFTASMLFVLTGQTGFDRAWIISEFSLDATDQVQLDELIAVFPAPPQSQNEFHFLFRSTLEVLESGMITTSEAETLLGI